MSVRILEQERFVDMRTETSYRIVHSSTERFVEHAHDYYETFVMLSGSVTFVMSPALKNALSPMAVTGF